MTAKTPNRKYPFMPGDSAQLWEIYNNMITIADGGGNSFPVFWRGVWEQQDYGTGEQVIDQDWLMIANKETTDRAAPQPTGGVNWILPTNPAWNPQAYIGVVYTGLRILPETGRIFSINEVRVWLPDVTTDAHYRVIVTDLITGGIKVGSPFLGSVLVAPGWYPVNLPSEFIIGGDDVAVVLESYNSSATTDFNHPWLYTGGTQAIGDPGTGNINHDNQQNLLRISNIDEDAVDRTAELQSVVPGTIIRVEEEGDPLAFFEYSVILPAGLPTWHDYEVNLVNTGQGGPLVATRCTVSFQVPVHASTDYVDIPGQYIGDPVLFGYLAFDTIESGTLNDVAYGVDVQYQQYVASPDWDYQAFSGSSSTGAVSAAPVNIAQSRVWWSRWLPAEHVRFDEALDGSKWTPASGPPPAGPLTTAELKRIKQFLILTSGPIVDLGESRLWQELVWLESLEILDVGRASVLIEP